MQWTKRRMWIVFPVLAAACVVLSACSGAPGSLSVADAWARPARAGENTAVYFFIENRTGVVDSLLEAQSPVAARAELHRTTVVDRPATQPAGGEGAEHEGGEALNPVGDEVMMMVPQERVEVPLNATVSFEPGGLHVMLIDLQQDLVEGETLRLVLQFEVVGEVQVEVPIENR